MVFDEFAAVHTGVAVYCTDDVVFPLGVYFFDEVGFKLLWLLDVEVVSGFVVYSFFDVDKDSSFGRVGWHSYRCLVAFDTNINLGCGVVYDFGFRYTDVVKFEVQEL